MDLNVKQGQIAHIDRNPANSRSDNLVFLCLEHHDQYDTRTSQSKGWTAEEVRSYKIELNEAIEAFRSMDRSQSTLANKLEQLHDAQTAYIMDMSRKIDQMLDQWPQIQNAWQQFQNTSFEEKE